MNSKAIIVGLLGVALFAAQSASADSRQAAPSKQGRLAQNGVFVMGNDPDVNTVLAYELVRGELEEVGTFATGGKGGAGGNQGGLAYAQKQGVLLAVNTGSDSITAFDVERGFLDLAGVVSSAGSEPISVASCTAPRAERALVYVLNRGSRSIAGYSLDSDGELTFLPGSVQSLSSNPSGPAQILFDNTCRSVVVVERNPASFMVYQLDGDGVAAPGVNVASLSAGQLGSAVTRGNQLLVSETGTSAASSFQLDPLTPTLSPISQTVANGQAGSCWAVATQRSFRCDSYGRGCTIGYIMNAGTSNITSYTIGGDGALGLREVIAQDTFGGAFDGALANQDRTLIVQSRPSNQERALNVYRIRSDGSLEFAQLIEGLPATTNSVAAAN